MPSVIEVYVEGWLAEERLKRDLAKQNYLNIHKKRKKKR